MLVCAKCFGDSEIQAYIELSQQKGDCQYCTSSKVSVLEIGELLDFFQELVGCFSRDGSGESLATKVQGIWSLFRNSDTAERILNSIIATLETDIVNANDLVRYKDEIIESVKHWDTLKHELKWSKRYISDLEKLQDLGWDSFFSTQFQLTPDMFLYRARLHITAEEPTFSPFDMKCPSPQFASAGRANPAGIPYLYLSDHSNTVLYEVRASYLDELSVGKFQLIDSLESATIVDFTENTSIFQVGQVANAVKGRLLRKVISSDLSRPMRRYDNELEYVPTQFICEYIREFTGAKGIRFSSSLHPEGKNFVLFDQQIVNCVSVERRRITRLTLQAATI